MTRTLNGLEVPHGNIRWPINANRFILFLSYKRRSDWPRGKTFFDVIEHVISFPEGANPCLTHFFKIRVYRYNSIVKALGKALKRRTESIFSFDLKRVCPVVVNVDVHVKVLFHHIDNLVFRTSGQSPLRKPSIRPSLRQYVFSGDLRLSQVAWQYIGSFMRRPASITGLITYLAL